MQGGKLLLQQPSFWRTTINDAKILSADMLCLKAVVHTIDRLLIPPKKVDTISTAGVVGTTRLMPSLTIMTNLLTSSGFLSLLSELQQK